MVAEINALRQQFGLDPGQVTVRYNQRVQAAALADEDPVLPQITSPTLSEYGLWGIATLAQSPPTTTPTNTVVNDWVFKDGWQGTSTQNLDCTSPSAPGCNGHRRAVLSPAPVSGAHLKMDVAVQNTTFDSLPALSVAVLMIWSKS